MYYEKNSQRAAEKMGWTTKEFEMRMLEITDGSRKILEAHWGLNGDGKRHQFNTIDKMLGINNSREAYKNAVAELEDCQFIEYLMDADKFSRKVASNLGRLAEQIFDTTNVRLQKGKINGCALLQKLITLTPREEYVLRFRYGLREESNSLSEIYVLRLRDALGERSNSVSLEEGSNPLSIEEVAKRFDLTRERIRQIEAKALRKMRHPSRAMLILYSESQQSEQKTPRVYPEHGSIEELDLSVRIFNCLMRAGVKTIEEFRVMSLDDVTKIRNLSDKCIEKISEIRSDMGVPLK